MPNRSPSFFTHPAVLAMVPQPPAQAAAAAAAASSADPGRWGHAEAEQLAQQIARQAHRYAQDPYQRTPWSVSSCEQVRLIWVGPPLPV